MCGIIGCVRRDTDARSVLVEGLSSLEYRGYDSAGIALSGDGNQLRVAKRSGELDALRDLLVETPVDGTAGVGHTRWSTHGPPTDANAHPHLDCAREVAVVHNGIIENESTLRAELEAAGHAFRSETDTEVVPHLIEDELETGAGPETAFRRAVARLEGSYALAAVFAGLDLVLAARNDSPLVLGVGDDATYLGSDVPAFLAHTDRVVYLDDGEFARLDSNGWAATDADGTRIEKAVETVEWAPEQTGKSGYDHYMVKEIHEQPTALRECIRGRVDGLSGRIELSELERLGEEPVDFVHLVACGTSYHAALFAAAALRDAGIPAQASLASEFATAVPPLPANGLVVGITQSGETADTLRALREAYRRNARTLAVTNVVGSTAARECDHVLYIRAGPEIGVAATKTFSSQVVAASLLTAILSEARLSVDARSLISALRDLSGHVQSVLDDSKAREVAEAYLDADAYFFIGRGYQYPVALEGALKMKEITYRHAEGFAAGELKHGPLALVSAETPVFAVLPGDGEAARKTFGNVKEVEARDAPVVAVTDGRTEVAEYADYALSIPETHPQVAPVLANVQLQLVAYHTAAALGRSIDKPRNLAKSVTVE